MRRRRAWVVVVGLVVAGALFLWLRSEPSVEGGPEPRASAISSAGVDAMAALLAKPVAAPQGSLHIKGRVRDAAGPAAGVVITVTRLEVGERLSDRTCTCADQCGNRLIDCGCGGSTEQILNLINQREGEAEPLARTRSDEQGRFDLDGLTPGGFTVWADGKTGAVVATEVQAGADELDLLLEPLLTLSGKVEGEDHQAIEGARVMAVLADHARELEVLTGPDGTFAFRGVVRGDYAVLADAADWVPAHVHAESTQPTDLTLTLLRPRKIAGSVTYEGKPAAGVTVESRGDHRIIPGRSDASGRFEIGGMRPGEYQLIAKAENGMASKSVTVGGEDITDVVLELGPAGSIEGSVRDEAGPIADAKVEIAPATGSGQVKTDAQGRFRVAPVVAGTYRVSVRAPHHLDPGPMEAKVAGTSAAQVTFIMKGSAELSGRVLDEGGHGVMGAEIQAMGDIQSEDELMAEDIYRNRFGAATSVDGGGFSFDSLTTGKYKLTIHHPDFVPATQSAAAPASKVTVTLIRGAEIVGQVSDAQGQGIARAQIAVYADRSAKESSQDEDEGTKSAISKPDGSFRVSGFRAGSYVVMAFDNPERQPGSRSSEGSWGSRRAHQAVHLDERQTATVELRMTAEARISGQVRDAAGNPLSGAQVLASTQSPEHRDRGAAFASTLMAIPHQTVSDPDGGFTLLHLEEGSFYVWGTHEGFHRSPPVQVSAGATDVVLALSASPRLRGRVIDAKGQPVTQFTVDRTSFAGADGGFFDAPLAEAGSYSVLVMAHGFATAHLTGSVADGEVQDVGDVVLNAGRTVHGTVLDEAGGPVGGARLMAVDPSAQDGAPTRWFGGGRQRSSVDGTFTLEHLPPEATRVIADDGQRRPAQHDLTPDEDHITLTLTRGATVHGTVLDAQKQPIVTAVEVAMADRSATRSGRTDSAGHYSISGLPAGAVYVNLEIPDGSAWTGNQGLAPRTVILAEGGDATVDLAATSGGGTLQVTVGADFGENLWVGLIAGPQPPPASRADASRLYLAALPPSGSNPSTFQGLTDGVYTVVAGAFSEGKVWFATKGVTISGGSSAAVSLSRADAVAISTSR